MRRFLRVAGATLNQMPLDWGNNRARIVAMLQEAKQAKVAVLCLPELCISGYGCEDMFNSPTVLRQAEASLAQILPHTKDLTVLIGMPIAFQSYVYNGAVMVQDCKILGVNIKKFLPREGVHYEPRWFQPWPMGVRADVSLCGQQVPIGDLSYNLQGVVISVEICEEAWHATPAATEHARAGAQLVLNPSASHFAFGKHEVRERLVANSSRSLQVHYVYTNLVGLEAGRMIYDGGVIIASCGDVVARGPRFGFDDGTLTAADIDLDLAAVGRLKSRPVREVTAASVQPVATIDGKAVRFVEGHPPELPNHTSAFGVFDADKSTDFLRAEALALFDYLRRSRAKGFVVSLSGGCDSGCVAVLVAHMWALALEVLGSPEALAKRIGLKKPDIRPEDPKSWIKTYFTCVYQKTANSSSATEGAARELAEAIGASFFVVDVQPMVTAYTNAMQNAAGVKLDWQHDDVTSQNIQARARAPMIWMFANQKQALLLSTSNRSEIAVGYATMDGDTAGGLAPLAGIDKRFLQAWSRWAENECTIGLGSIAALSHINQLAPTAELRPADKQQRDEDDLMPYALLERIERLLIRDKMGLDAASEQLINEFPTIKASELSAYVQKFARLWTQSQWKRERYAPGFHLDDESLDPKTWCRFPILSAGWDG